MKAVIILCAALVSGCSNSELAEAMDKMYKECKGTTKATAFIGRWDVSLKLECTEVR